MMRFAWVTIPCVLLALAACGERKPVPAPAPAPAPEGLPAPVLDERADEPSVVDWRAVDSDEDEPGRADTPGETRDEKPKAEDPGTARPRRDDEADVEGGDGTGAWCGTGMRRDPWGSFRRAGNEVVMVELPSRVIVALSKEWSETGADGLRRRFVFRRLTYGEEEALKRRRILVMQSLRETKSADAFLARRREMADVEQRLRLALRGWIQVGLVIDGTEYLLRARESEALFLERARAEAAKARAPKEDPKGKGDKKDAPKPEGR